MTLSRATVLLATVAWLVTLPPVVWGLGAAGHRAVGAIAWQQLDESNRNRVAALLGPGSRPFEVGCNWPDEIKMEPEFRLTRSLHYVNIPPQQGYDAERDCRLGNCLVGAIEHYAAQWAQPDLPEADQRDAVRFLCHFVGDLHQPLHVGYRHDLGGNRYLLDIGESEQVDLHTLWDHGISGLIGDWDQMLETVGAACSIDPNGVSFSEHLQEWLAESRGLLESPGPVYPEGRELTMDYLSTALPIYRRQLCLAGKRLAWLLERTWNE